MALANRHRFDGKINGIKIRDIKLNYFKNSVSDRLEEVSKLLEGKDDSGRNIFETYTDDFYMVGINKEEETSLNHEVFKKVEQLASYVLGSTEVRQERKDTVYKFYTNEEEFKLRTGKEQNLENMVGADNSTEDVIHYLLNKNNNYKKSKRQVINGEDLTKDNYCGKVLRDYDVLLKRAQYLIQNPNETKLSRFQLTNMVGGIKQDMIDTKDILNGTFGYILRNPLPENKSTDWSLLDLQNSNHIKPLLFCNKGFQMDSDLSFVIMDLNKTLKIMLTEGKISKKAYTVIQMARQGWTLTDIAYEFKVTVESISLLITRTSVKIAKYHKEKGIR